MTFTSEPTRVKIEVALTRPGLVVLSDTYAPGWVALLRSAEAFGATGALVFAHSLDVVEHGDGTFIETEILYWADDLAILD